MLTRQTSYSSRDLQSSTSLYPTTVSIPITLRTHPLLSFVIFVLCTWAKQVPRALLCTLLLMLLSSIVSLSNSEAIQRSHSLNASELGLVDAAQLTRSRGLWNRWTGPVVRRGKYAELPSTLSAFVQLNHRSGRGDICEGVLLSETLVLTYGQCARVMSSQRSSQAWRVRAHDQISGSTTSRSTRHQISVKQSIIHPDQPFALHLLSRPLHASPLRLHDDQGHHYTLDAHSLVAESTSLSTSTHHFSFERNTLSRNSPLAYEIQHAHYGPFVVSRSGGRGPLHLLTAIYLPQSEEVLPLSSSHIHWLRNTAHTLNTEGRKITPLLVSR